MYILLLSMTLLGYTLAFPAWRLKQERVHWFTWDYGVPVFGIATWFILIMLEIGNKVSMSNFVVEVFWIFIFSAASPWLRVVLPGKGRFESLMSSFIFLLLPVILAVILRITTPTLPI